MRLRINGTGSRLSCWRAASGGPTNHVGRALARRLFVFCSLCFLWAGAGFASDAMTTNQMPFLVGEQLIYNIHWGVFNVGQTKVTTGWTNYQGKTALRIRYVTKSNSVIARFYPVNDLIESMIDPDTFRPYYFIKRLSEGRYRADEITTFDFDKKEMTWKSKLNGRSKTLPIDADTRDIVTMMYYLRGQPFQTGTTNQYRVMADEKLYDLFLTTHDTDGMKFEKWGRVRSFEIEPQAAFKGLFERKGKITFWVSQDSRQVCTRVMAEVPVANIRITLADVKGPGDDFWVKKTER